MPTTDQIWFETLRRAVLLKPTTQLPEVNGTVPLLTYDADPNLASSTGTAGEQLLYYIPIGTFYAQNNGTMWVKQPTGWVQLSLGASSGGGGSGSTIDLTGVSGVWQSTYTDVNTTSAQWNSVYTDVSTSSAGWDSVYTDVSTSSAGWDSVYTTVNDNSGSWGKTDLTGVSGNWESAYNTLHAASGAWSSGNAYLPQSGSWDSVYNTVLANSANWVQVVLPLSATWNSVYTDVNTNSASWDSAYTTVSANSGNWGKTDLTGVSGNWESTYTTVSANSGNWGKTDLTGVSADWESTYTTVSANSGNWDHSTAGYLTSVSIPTSSSWNSTYTTVSANSANWGKPATLSEHVSSNWESTYTTVSGNSANWGKTDLTGLSSNWESTYTTVSSESAIWSSAYTIIQTESANWVSTPVDSDQDDIDMVIAPIAFTQISTVTNGTTAQGTNIKWEYFFSNNVHSYALVEFNAEQATSDYIVVTDPQGDDKVRCKVTAKTVSGFRVDFLDPSGDPEQDTLGVTVMVYSPDLGVLNINQTDTYVVPNVNTQLAVLSGDWESTYSTVYSLSDTWGAGGGGTGGSITDEISGNWESTYTTVSANSAGWGKTDLTGVSGNWESTYTTVSSGSANWNDTYSTVQTESGEWNKGPLAYSIIEANSADWITTIGDGTPNSGSVIAPFAFANVNATTNGLTGLGTNLRWSYTYNPSVSSFYTVQFDTPRSNTKYTVVTDSEGDDSVRMIVREKTTSGFKIDTRTATGVVDVDTIGHTIMVYDENPLVGTLGGGGGGTGSSSLTSVIAPFAFGFVDDIVAASGTGISWSNWDSSNSRLDFTFDTEQPDTNYAVITDSETFDDYFVGVTNKTVSGFRAEFYDNSQSRTPSNFSPFTFVIYGSTPTYQAGVIADQDLRTTVSTSSADWNLGLTSWTTITANSGAWLNGGGNGGNSGGSGVGSAGVFITQITCGSNGSRDNGITNTFDDPDVVAVGTTVPKLSALVDTPTVRLHAQWEGTSTEWTGSPYISSFALSSNPITHVGGNSRRFTGYIDLDLSAYRGTTANIPFTYGGVSKTLDVAVAGLGPEVQNFQVISSPSYGQDHYKDGDDVTFVIEFDTTDVSSVTFGGGDAYAIGYASDVSTTMTGTSATFTRTIDTTLQTKTARPFNITAKNALGTEGQSFTSTDTVEVVIGPIITNVGIGAYPGSQTELKRDDFIDITFELDTTNADRITFGGSATGVQHKQFFSMNGLSATVAAQITNATTSNNSGGSLIAFLASATMFNHHGGAPQINSSSDFGKTLKINNQGPTISTPQVEYLNGFLALKDTEQARVTSTVTTAGANPTYSYTSSELTITDPTTYTSAKTVTRINPGTNYNVNSNNFTISVTREENDKTTTANAVVKIANVAPVIRVYSNSQNATQGVRMKSGGLDNTATQSYNIQMYSDQQLFVLPVLEATSGGTLGTFTGNLNDGAFDATMIVHDTDPKGTFNYTGLSALNIAGKKTTTISTNNNSSSSYTLGGFVSRTLARPANGRASTMGVKVSDSSKVVLTDSTGWYDPTNWSLYTSYSNGQVMNQNTEDQSIKFTITDSSAINTVALNGDTIWNMDLAHVQLNQSGTATWVVREDA